jgi:hypothetical protein
MTAIGLVERVKGWLNGDNGGHGHGRPHEPPNPRQEQAVAYLARTWARAGGGAAAEGAAEDGAASAASAPARTAAGRMDPLDPPWIDSIGGLPAQIADSIAEQAAGTHALEQIAGELEGHRQTTRTLAAAVKRLPDVAAGHAELSRETNRILQRQSLVLESMLDGLAALRAAFGTVEESSRRHLKAIALLESSHRQILFEYQTMFLRSHRLVGYLAGAAVILAAGAIGGLAYVAWNIFAAP